MSDLISSDLDDDTKNSWGTDPAVFDALNKEFNFSLDAAANHKNNKVPNNYLTKEDDALSKDWEYEILKVTSRNLNVWINPPYGKGYIKKFMQKCIEQKAKGVTSVMLVPATLDAQWLPINDISEIRIVTGGRLSFYHPVTNKKVNGNTKGSMLVIFRPSKMPLNIRLIDRNELLGTNKTNLKGDL
jgi:phage N-6-adenine-methyltransferase